jgi:DNA-binding transcriptional MerR regulator
MRKTATRKEGLLRISEVARASGVSLPTLHYYLREGLLAPSAKTARNMAYYSPDCVEDIRWIKELQSKKFLPLAIIKLILHDRQTGQNSDHILEMRSIMDDIFQPLAGEPRSLTFQELIGVSGLEASGLETLESCGLLLPAETPEGKRYDDIDVRIARTVKELGEYGLKPADMRVYQPYMQAVRLEAAALHAKLHSTRDHGRIPIRRVINTLSSLKACLTQKIYRQLALEDHPDIHLIRRKKI